MEDIVDIDYLASSSAHTYQVYKPSKTKSANNVKTVSQLNGGTAYDKYIDKLNMTYCRIEKSVFTQLADELEDYVQQVNNLYTSESVKAFRQIQCAIVSMSININGLNCLYEMLFKQVKGLISLSLIVTSERVKSVSDFAKLLHENITQYMNLDKDEAPQNFYSCIADFYHNNNDHKHPLLVVFEDFDCFSPNLLSDLLILIHESLEKMPLMLICCQSTDILPLNMRLPSKATNKLQVQHFSFRSTKEFFEKLISDICWDPESSFKLGPKTISHITDVYNLWDTSLSGAFRRVKLCVFEHFFNKNYAKLCCPTNELDDTISTLTDDELISIRDLPSLQGLANLPVDNETFKSTLKKSLTGFCEYLDAIQDELKLYHRIKVFLHPEETLTFLMDTWITFLNSKRLSQTGDFKFLEKKFLLLDKFQIIELMDQLSKLVESGHSDIYKALKNHFKDFESKIHEDSAMDHKENKPYDPQMRTRASNGINSPRKTPMARAEFLKHMKQQTKIIRKIKKWQDDFVDILKNELDKIRNPLHSPYNEIFFFDDIDLVKQFSMPAARQDILYALESPEKILNCKCCHSIGPNSPDISITYAIYCDNLRVANLAKCFDIFKSMIAKPVEPATRVSPRKKAKKETQKVNEKHALARFIDSIGDLEYLGLLRAHPRKVDHIERLVWPIDSHSVSDLDSDELNQMSKKLHDFTLSQA